jgi:hypothetical protein
MDKKDYTYIILYECYTDFGYIERDILTITSNECWDSIPKDILISSLKAEILIYLQQYLMRTSESNFKILEICLFKDGSSYKDLWNIMLSKTFKEGVI